MKKRRFWMFLLVCVAVFGLTAASVSGAEKKFRIGYLQGGDYPSYEQIVKAIMKNLTTLGWADKLEFPADAVLSADWNREKCSQMAHQLAARTDLDMIWTAGTWAGQEIAKTDNKTTPIFVLSVSNAKKSGIVPSYEDSGRDNLTTRIDPTKYERQIRLFYDLFRFKRLGFVYADTATGRTYADVDTLEKLSKELGFDLVAYNKVPENRKDAPAAILEGVKEIAPKIDAYYMTICIGFSVNQVPAIMQVLNQHKIPTMSMYGADFVKVGALMTIADSRFAQRARWTAMKIVKVLQGAKARDFPIVFAPGPRLAINLAGAKLINWDPPIDVLGISDHIFNEVKTPEQVRAEQVSDWAGEKGIWELAGIKR